jgi:hypothetical protein
MARRLTTIKIRNQEIPGSTPGAIIQGFYTKFRFYMRIYHLFGAPRFVFELRDLVWFCLSQLRWGYILLIIMYVHAVTYILQAGLCMRSGGNAGTRAGAYRSELWRII